MKKQCIYSLLIIMFIFILAYSSHAAQLKQGNYFENHQWGDLEQIYFDFNKGKISTEECALYGLYILAAHDPHNIYRKEKFKLLPSKYTHNKKSIEAGPYFFVYFLYKNEEKFTQKVQNEFQASEWCEDTYINEIVSNPKVDQAIIFFQKSNKYDNDFFTLLLYLAETGIISYESLHITIMIEDNNIQKFKKHYLSFIKKFNLRRNKNRTFLLGDLLIKSQKYKFQKAVNIINFHYKFYDLMRRYGHNQNECYKNDLLVGWGRDIKNI